jgi:hypothetical protein
MTEIDGNQSGGQAPTRKKRTAIFKQLKAAGLAVARVIVEPDGKQIIELAGVQPEQPSMTPLEEWKHRRAS